MPGFITTSPRWQIFNAVAAALESAPELQGVPVKRNPTSAIALKRGDYLVVVRWNADALTEKRGQVERRQFRLMVGSIAATETADRDADAMHVVVGEVARRTLTELAREHGVGNLTEREITPDLDNILIEGALVLSAWDVNYQKPTTAFGPT
jgi:hypothetical protein